PYCSFAVAPAVPSQPVARQRPGTSHAPGAGWLHESAPRSLDDSFQVSGGEVLRALLGELVDARISAVNLAFLGVDPASLLLLTKNDAEPAVGGRNTNLLDDLRPGQAVPGALERLEYQEPVVFLLYASGLEAGIPGRCGR